MSVAAKASERDGRERRSTMSEASPWWHFEYLPVGVFGSVMGLTGTSVGWDLAHQRLGLPWWPSPVFGSLAVLDFVVVAAAYSMKVAFEPTCVVAEFKHPVGGSLFATIFTSLLLLPLILAPYALVLARIFWFVRATCMIVLAWLVVGP